MQGLAAIMHLGHDLQGGNNAIAGGGFIQTNNMAGVFPTQNTFMFTHHFQHIAVTYIRSQQIDAQLLKPMLHAQIGH